MAQRGTPYLIPFGAHGMVAHPNRWLSQAGELGLAENVVLENDLIQKEPTTVYYDATGVDNLDIQLGFGASETWLALLVWVVASPPTTTPPAIAAPTINQSSSPGPGTTWVVSVLTNVPAGALHAVRFAQASATGVTAMTDSQGNIYTLMDSASGGGMHTEIWTSILTTALTASDTVTMTLASGAPDVNALATAIEGVRAPVSQVARLSGTGVGTTIILGPTHSHTYPVVGIASIVTTSVASSSFSAPTPWVSAGVSLLTQQLEGFVTGAFDSGNYIIAQTEWDSDATNSPAGTVTTVRGSTTVVGVGTSFTTAYRPGDDIIVGGESQVVDFVTNNTTLDTIDKWDTSSSAVAHVRRAGPVLITVVNRERFTTAAMYKELPDQAALGLHGDLDATTIASTLAKVRRGRFVVGGKEIAANNRKLFYLNGMDPIKVLSGDGTLAASIANPSADWAAGQDATKQPINAIVHQDSLMAFGNLNDPHRLYISSTEDHEDFRTAPTSTGITLRIASNVGNRLFCAAQYQGVLFLAKYPNGIFYLDDTAIDRFQWGYRVRSMALGVAPSPHAMLATDDDVIFCDPQGHFHLLSAVNTLGGTRDSDLTRALGLHQWTEQNVDVAALDRLVSVYDDQTKTAWFGLRSLQADENLPDNDLVIRWDFGRERPRMTTARFWKPNTLCLKHRNFIGRQAVLIGEIGDSWFVRPGAYGSRTNFDFINSVPVDIGVPTTIIIPELDFSDQRPANRTSRKAYRSVELVSQNLSFQPVTVTIAIDGVIRDSVTFPTNSLRRRDLRVVGPGDGHEFSASITTDGSVALDDPILGVIVYYEPLGQDQSRRS